MDSRCSRDEKQKHGETRVVLENRQACRYRPSVATAIKKNHQKSIKFSRSYSFLLGEFWESFCTEEVSLWFWCCLWTLIFDPLIGLLSLKVVKMLLFSFQTLFRFLSPCFCQQRPWDQSHCTRIDQRYDRWRTVSRAKLPEKMLPFISVYSLVAFRDLLPKQLSHTRFEHITRDVLDKLLATSFVHHIDAPSLSLVSGQLVKRSSKIHENYVICHFSLWQQLVSLSRSDLACISRFAHWFIEQWGSDLPIWNGRVRKLWVQWFFLSRTRRLSHRWWWQWGYDDLGWSRVILVRVTSCTEVCDTHTHTCPLENATPHLDMFFAANVCVCVWRCINIYAHNNADIQCLHR